MLPPVVVLENVAGYRQYDSYGYIVAALRLHHYHVCDWLLNAADYGVPQQRRRLIMIAQRHAIPQRPSATHKCHADMFSPQWRGWYDAVADLVPTLPQAQLANWQRRRLPAWVTETVLLSNQATERTDGLMTAHEPALSITEQHNGRLRALLLDDQFSSAGGLDGTVPLDHADVRSLTPRALARLQSVPDSYVLPDARRLACSIIGRGVPCVLAQRIGEHVRGVIA
jgi:DNA (cytosine-5)-methyltransferase 1